MATALASATEQSAPESTDYLRIIERAKRALEHKTPIKVPISDIRPYPNQPRKYFDPERQRLLSASIDEIGQAISGIVRVHPDGNGYELIDGERRWRAIHLIPEERRPLYKADLVDIGNDDEVVQFLVSGITNFNRAEHTHLELLETIKRNQAIGIPMGVIADLLGYTEVWISQIYGLRALQPDVLKLIDTNLPKSKRIPVQAAIHISKVDDPKLQQQLAARVLSKEVPVSQLRVAVISTAREAGVPVRTREAEPSRRWESVIVGIRNLNEVADKVKEHLSDPAVAKFAVSRGLESAKMKQDLSLLDSSLRVIQEKIRKAR